MDTRNLISIKQLRQGELSGYALAVATGYFIPYISGVSGYLKGYVDSSVAGLSGLMIAMSGVLASQIATGAGGSAILQSGFRIPIASGVDTVNVAYGFAFGSQPKVCISMETTGVSNPYLLANILKNNTTGCSVGLSDITRSSFYNLDLFVTV